jgi:hypothetical protein
VRGFHDSRKMSRADRSMKRVAVASLDQIVSFFRKQGKTVVTLVGFSGAGYEHPDRIRKKVTRILDRHDPATTIVNIGVTADGIGRAYRWAKARGFFTTGIVSSEASKYGATVAPGCDKAFFVEDETWGGVVNGKLTPTSEAMVSVSNLMIAVGGGEIARDELVEMEKRNKPIRFLAADMNHAKAVAKAAGKGLPDPTPSELRGAAHARFGED